MKKDTLIVVILSVVLIGIIVLIINKAVKPKVTLVTSTNPPAESVMEKKQYTQAPAMQLDPAKQYQATLKTSAGDITIKLNTQQTPVAVNNFVFLAREGFYDQTIFHRAIAGFMIQGGDPQGTGGGGPGYRFADEPIEGEYNRGTVAMANAGPNTNGSQFFIMHQDYALPKNYVIFGQVIAGLEVVDAIANAPVTQNSSGEKSKPVAPVVVQSVNIMEQ